MAARQGCAAGRSATVRLALLAAMLAVAAPVSALRYQSTALGALAGHGNAINSAGVIVGFGHPDAPSQLPEAFYYDRSGIHFLTPPDPSANSNVFAISNGGVIAGSVGSPPKYRSQAVIYRNGAYTMLGNLGGDDSAAQGVNDHGQVAGGATDAAGVLRAFVSTAGVMRDLGTLGGASSGALAINDAGQIAGFADIAVSPAAHHAFLSDGGALQDLGTLGGANSLAFAINALGQVTGTSDMPSGLPHAFIYTNGRLRDLGSLGGGYSEGYAINNVGQVVGTSFPAAGAGAAMGRASLYTDGAMVDLNTLASGLGGYVLAEANGINDAGQIVANGCNASIPQCQPFLLSPLPDAVPRVRLVEYYYAPFDHYFMTSQAGEIALLDAALPPFNGWVRTGFSFLAYAPTTAPASASRVCRFFNASFSPRSSHFYAAHGAGCEVTLAGFPDWQLEDAQAFAVDLPNAAGTCAAGELPVYRLYNNGMGGAPGHRFVTDIDERMRLLGEGWVAEGSGIGVAMCSAPL